MGHKISDWWDQAAPYVAGLGLALVLVFAGVIIYQNYQQHHFTVVAHAKSLSQQNEIIRVLNEHTTTLSAINELRDEVTKLDKTAGPALTAGQNALLEKLTWIECTVSGSTTCGPRP